MRTSCARPLLSSASELCTERVHAFNPQPPFDMLSVAYPGGVNKPVNEWLLDMEPTTGSLQDFVRLAKWEDRGYYAMKATTERNQRQLHRLTRRAEEALSQPAAAVLAAASKAMGFADLAHASVAGPPTVVGQGNQAAKDGQGNKATFQGARRKATQPMTPEQVEPPPHGCDDVCSVLLLLVHDQICFCVVR